MLGRDNRRATHAHRQRTEQQEERNRCRDGGIAKASAATAAQHCLLFMHQRFEQADQGDFAVEKCIANGHGGLAGENFDHLGMRQVEKIGITALVQKQADATLVIRQRQRVESAIAGSLQNCGRLRQEDGSRRSRQAGAGAGARVAKTASG